MIQYMKLGKTSKHLINQALKLWIVKMKTASITEDRNQKLETVTCVRVGHLKLHSHMSSNLMIGQQKTLYQTSAEIQMEKKNQYGVIPQILQRDGVTVM